MARGSSDGGWPRRAAARAAAAGVLVALLVGCTEPEPTPTPSPTPEEESEPAPSGVDVAVVLPPADDRSTLTLLEADRRLADLAEARVGDVAGIRPVIVDDAGFVPDTAALLAGRGADLVCVFGDEGERVAVELADRFPATRFCAVGEAGDATPDNVDLFEVAHEELGHVLGIAAAQLAGAGPVGVVLGDDSDDRARRRAGARAALAASSVAVDATAVDIDAAVELEEAAVEAELAVMLVDTSSATIAEVLAAAAPEWIGPAGLATDGPATVRWSVRVDAIVGAAVDRLVNPDDADLPTRLGFAQELFAVSYTDAVPEDVRDVVQVAADELARGARDPLTAVSPGEAVPSPPPEAPPEEAAPAR